MNFPLVLALLALLGYCGADPAPVRKGRNQVCYNCKEGCFHKNCAVQQCSNDAPFCSTIITGPDYSTIMTCALEKGTRPCLLKHSQNQGYELVCYCENDRCNIPFNEELKSELIRFATINYPAPEKYSDYFDQFKRQSLIYRDVPDANIYRYFTSMLTGKFKRAHSTNTSSNDTRQSRWVDMPLAEALRLETTVPSDDDEDESEGSGSFEEYSSAPPAPAEPGPPAPSPRLPATAADSSAAPLTVINLLSTTQALFINLLYMIISDI